MNTLQRLGKVHAAHGLCAMVSKEALVWGGGQLHKLLDLLDKKIGVDTRGGVRHDPCCGPPHGQPKNYVGTRIRLHEEYIRKDAFPGLIEPSECPDAFHFWGESKPWRT